MKVPATQQVDIHTPAIDNQHRKLCLPVDDSSSADGSLSIAGSGKLEMLTVAAMQEMARGKMTESHVHTMAGLPKKPRTEAAAGPSRKGGSTFRAWSPPRPTFDEPASDEVPSTSGRQERAWSPPRPPASPPRAPSGRGEGAWSPPRPPGAEEKEGMCWLANSRLSSHFEEMHSGGWLQKVNT